MKSTLEEKISTAATLLDVLLILKDKIALDIHVATMAYVVEHTQKIKNDDETTNKYGIIRCKPFPLDAKQEEYIIEAYYFTEDGDDLQENNIVIILFMDRNFINDLKAIDNRPRQTNDLMLHTIKYGVIMKTY